VSSDEAHHGVSLVFCKSPDIEVNGRTNAHVARTGD
jgi:hypothetical protein